MHEAREIKVRWGRKTVEHTVAPEGVFGFLERLRAKPVHVRKRIAFVATLALSSVVAGVWWNAFNAESALSEQEPVAVSSPWDVVRDTIVGVKDVAVGTYDEAITQARSISAEYAPGSATAAVGQTEVDRAAAPVVEDNIVYPDLVRADVANKEVADEALRTRPGQAEEVHHTMSE